MATNVEYQYLCEDVVYKVDKKGNVIFGIVFKNSTQDSSDSSDAEYYPLRKKDVVYVLWHPSGINEPVNREKVHLADKSLMPGDVVRRMIKGKDTQRGYCRDVQVTACVQVMGTKQILMNIRSEDLIPLKEFTMKSAVCMGCWVGGIRVTNVKIRLATPDGSRCEIDESCEGFMRQLKEQRDEKRRVFPRPLEFYVGQRLWISVNFLEPFKWLHCTKEMKTQQRCKPRKLIKIKVEDVETEWVGIHWHSRAFSKDGVWSDEAEPKFFIEGDDLKRLKPLNVFRPSTIRVGTRSLYVVKGNEIVMSREQWLRQQRENLQVRKQTQEPRPNISVTRPPEDRRRDKDRAESGEENSGQNNQNGQPTMNSNNLMPPTQSQSESSDDWDTEDTGSQSDTASVSSGCSSMSSMGKKKKGPALMTKLLKKKKLCKAKKKVPPIQLVPDTKIAVEVLSTNTKATVVWQDGSVEFGVPSTQLLPIHHLDDKEFFPGDFVVDQKEETRIYGVVQSVDHQGRTAKIKWFRTYTSSQSPQPTLLEERAVSVYDLKDHPDFQYRPGTVVIRIANFEGEDAGCAAGQVLDNYPEGRVKVWWVDGHVSMCWPQDLYNIGDYDSDEGEFWDSVSSDASWQTELEHCFIAEPNSFQQAELDVIIKPKLAAHIEKARIAMSRLEEIFTQNPALQTTEVMRKLLEVYKDCRNMDKLMGTSFFHESHFQGLLERVRERGRAKVAQKMADQVNRLFTMSEGSEDGKEEDALEKIGSGNLDLSLDESRTPEKDTSANLDKSSDQTTESKSVKDAKQLGSQANVSVIEPPATTVAQASPEESRKSSKKGAEDTEQLFISMKPNTEDSGLFSVETSKKESGSSESSGEFLLSEDQTPSKKKKPESPGAIAQPVLLPPGNSNVCVRLCTLIKAQLVLAHAEVSKRFSLSRMSLWDTETDSDLQERPLEDLEPIVAPETECPVEIPPPVYAEGEGFSIEEAAPDSHKFKLTMFQPSKPTNFFKTVSKELKLLKSSLPPGIWVKGFEDRIDLYSAMFRGPEQTPYEDGLFLFDLQLSANYPSAPPLCHYISYCNDRLNPNLYEDGKVCVSLLGTWSGRGTEVWTTSSTLLQVIVSIQGLILVPEPYFNEAGFEKQKGSQQGRENSRMYNEMVVLKLVQAQTKLLLHPPSVFKDIIIGHFQRHGERLLRRLELWMEISEQHNTQHPLSPATPTTFKEIADVDEKILPEFPLIPASRGFCITLRKTLATFKEVLVEEGIISGKTHAVRAEVEASRGSSQPAAAVVVADGEGGGARILG